MAADRPRLLAQRRILVVDDQPSIRGVLERALAEAGAEVWSAEDGAAALRMLDTGTRPEVILLDLMMPVVDGWQVLDRLVADPETATIPVVLQTSSQDFASFERARRAGVAAFISKPFRLHEVVETCRRIIEGARPLQGRDVGGMEGTRVQLRDRDGNLIAMGSLLDLAPRGAQVELETALAPALVVALTIHGPDGVSTHQAEVRWVTRTGRGFCHGLYFPGL